MLELDPKTSAPDPVTGQRYGDGSYCTLPCENNGWIAMTAVFGDAPKLKVEWFGTTK